MNRLVDSSYDGRKESFTYDKVGNRLTKTTNDITEKYVYNIKNQLKEVYQKKGNSTHLRSLSKFDLAKYKIWSLTYDKQGNTLKEETPQGTNFFEYNALNQQVKAITKEGNTLVNRYDSEGLRYEIEENEKLSKFIFNKNGDTLVELDQNNEVVSRFIRGYEIVAADVKDDRYYYSVDEQGSTEFITDETYNIKNEYRYDAFGNILESKEDIHNRITYTGQQFDNITQQYYLRARFYNPVIGRFTQEDSYRGDGLNLYAYCENNPVGYYDSSGYAKNCKSKTQSQKSIDKKTKHLKKQGFQEHHIISDKNKLTKNHKLLKLAGYTNPDDFLQTQKNKIFLPNDKSKHPTRSIHKGRHYNSVSQNLADKMDAVVIYGEENGWKTDDYSKALNNIVKKERNELRTGKRILNKNHR